MREEHEIRKAVKEHYAELANTKGRAGQSGCCAPSGITASSGKAGQADLCRTIGYTDEQLEKAPAEARQVGAGCGNPVKLAQLKAGQTVLDLGSGGGLDAFLAADQVGPSGKVIGVDATPEMVWRARETARNQGYQNVEFRLGEIEHLPMATESVDVVISNCVINLSPDKSRVFREAFRVLKPGGEFAVSDIIATAPLPESLHRNLALWSSCAAGALTEAEYCDKLRQAGFINIEVRKHHYRWEDVEPIIAANLGDSELVKSLKGLVEQRLLDKIVSAETTALKPGK